MAKVTVILPKKHKDKAEAICSNIDTWYCVSNIRFSDGTITWDQSKFHGAGEESLSAFMEGVQVALYPERVIRKVEH